jgi:conjugative transfer signal peptidase TraF
VNPKLVVLAKTALVTAAAFSLFSLYSSYVPYSLVWNRTPSIPMGVYLSEEVTPSQLVRGNLACFAYAPAAWALERKYFPVGVALCKPVMGVAGDVVQHDGDKLFVIPAGTTQPQLLGEYTQTDSAHRPLPQDALSNGAIPQNAFLMVAGAHKNSLDSRYLGLIPAAQVQRRIHPLYTW